MSILHPSAIILVVDDDRGIREFTSLLLRRVTAATVLEAATPDAGLRIARANGGIHLLISDIDLKAELDGVQMANQVVATSPGTNVILMSGSHAPREGMRPEWRFLPKPFAIGDLMKLVKLQLGVYPMPVSYAGMEGGSLGLALGRKAG